MKLSSIPVDVVVGLKASNDLTCSYIYKTVSFLTLYLIRPYVTLYCFQYYYNFHLIRTCLTLVLYMFSERHVKVVPAKGILCFHGYFRRNYGTK